MWGERSRRARRPRESAKPDASTCRATGSNRRRRPWGRRAGADPRRRQSAPAPRRNAERVPGPAAAAAAASPRGSVGSPVPDGWRHSSAGSRVPASRDRRRRPHTADAAFRTAGRIGRESAPVRHPCPSQSECSGSWRRLRRSRPRVDPWRRASPANQMPELPQGQLLVLPPAVPPPAARPPTTTPKKEVQPGWCRAGSGPARVGPRSSRASQTSQGSPRPAVGIPPSRPARPRRQNRVPAACHRWLRCNMLPRFRMSGTHPRARPVHKPPPTRATPA